jgi:hypothetical protein
MKTYCVFVLTIILMTTPLLSAKNLVCNAGFEDEPNLACGRPTDYCYWCGNVTEIVSATDGITPLEGSQMLKFMYTLSGCEGPGYTENSDLWQIVDVSRFAALISVGKALASASANFNRIAGDPDTDTEFFVEIRAYAGDPHTFPNQFGNDELAMADCHIETDGDLETWESASVDLVLPTDTDFIAIALGASENVFNDLSGVEFDGHYGDAVSASIITAPEPVCSKSTVTQAGTTETIKPIKGTTDAVSFYDYYSASAHTPFVEDQISKIYLYEDPQGNLSLVMHHSKDSSTSPNMKVDFDLDGVPDGAYAALSDDPTHCWDPPRCQEFSLDYDLEGHWYHVQNSDGGVLSGLPTDQPWCITINPNFIAGILGWDFETPAETMTLNMNEPIEICFCQEVGVDVDIKPQSCPNPLNLESKGILPVAILGSADFDASEIDPASVCLAGVASFRSSLEDVASSAPDTSQCIGICDCTTQGPDGYTDLTLKFKNQAIVAALGDVNNGDVLPLDLTGVLKDGTPIEGTDCIVVVGNFKAFKKGDINKDGITDTVDFTLMAQTWLQSTVVQEE